MILSLFAPYYNWKEGLCAVTWCNTGIQKKKEEQKFDLQSTILPKFFVLTVYTILFPKLFLESSSRKLRLNCYMSKLLRAKIKL